MRTAFTDIYFFTKKNEHRQWNGKIYVLLVNSMNSHLRTEKI